MDSVENTVEYQHILAYSLLICNQNTSNTTHFLFHLVFCQNEWDRRVLMLRFPYFQGIRPRRVQGTRARVTPSFTRPSRRPVEGASTQGRRYHELTLEERRRAERRIQRYLLLKWKRQPEIDSFGIFLGRGCVPVHSGGAPVGFRRGPP